MSDHPTITALKATAPSIHSPLPWSVHSCLYNMRDAEGNATADVLTDDDAAHIAAAVNAAPHLLARVAELEAVKDSLTTEVLALRAALEAARVAVAELPEYYHEASCGIECGHKDCDCPAEYGETKRIAARRAVGLEVTK